jgi:competence protein ComEC
MNLDTRDDTLLPFVEKNTKYSALVVSEPEMKDITQRFIVRVSDAEGRPVSENVLVIANRYPEYSYGDALRIVGTLKRPENFETYAGGPIFDYVSYLYKDGVRYTMYRPKIEKVGEGEGNPVISLLYSIKNHFSQSVESVIHEPESSLLLGLLTGDKTSLGKDVLDDFRRSGLSHIIVLSGYNVTIVAENLMRAFSYMSVALSPFFGVISIILFALMTGASATTVRASIMALLFIFSRRISRRYDVSRALLFAAFLMVMHSPRILVFDISFQLSVLATIAIIYVAPLVRNRLTWVTERYMLRDIVSATIGTQIFVLPYILHVMGTLSIVSIASNTLVLPLVPLAMFSGFITGVIGLISPLLATPLGWLSNIVLSYIVEVAHVSASLPFATIHLSLPLVATVMLYIVFAFLLFYIYKRRPSETDDRPLRILSL